MEKPIKKTKKINKQDLSILEEQAEVFTNYYQELAEMIISLVKEGELSVEGAHQLIKFNKDHLEDKVLNLVAQGELNRRTASYLLKSNSYTTIRERMYQKGLIDW